MASTIRRDGTVKKSGSAHGGGGVRYGVYARGGFECVFCGAHRVVFSLEHVTCQSHGGSDTAGNYAVSCYSCNSARKNRTDAKFFAELEAKGIDTMGISTRIAAQIVGKADLKLGRKLEIVAKAARARSKRAGGTEMQGNLAASRAARKSWLAAKK